VRDSEKRRRNRLDFKKIFMRNYILALGLAFGLGLGGCKPYDKEDIDDLSLKTTDGTQDYSNIQKAEEPIIVMDITNWKNKAGIYQATPT